MKILLLSPMPPPSGGIASWTLNIMEYSSLKIPGLNIFNQDTALKYRNILKNDLFSRIYFGIFEVSRIYKELKANITQFKPDVVHLTSIHSLALIKDLLILITLRRRKIPLILHWHFGEIPKLSQTRGFQWRLLVFLIKKSNTSVVIDPLSYKVLINNGLNNVVYIPNPVGLSLEKKARMLRNAERKVNSGCLSFVGHVIKEKGVFELIEAVTFLPFVNELNIIGPYEESVRDVLARMAERRDGVAWLKFHGAVPNDVVLEIIRKSTAIILPSYTEGFPVVVLEAMAMGCPVIATSAGAIQEMLAVNSDEACGICVPVKDINSLKKAIISLMEDPVKARKMGRNGIERVLKHYTLREVMKQYLSLWEKTVNIRQSEDKT